MAERAIAEKIAREKAGAAYIPLVCGHQTDRETQDQYRLYSSRKRSRYWCEQCGSWESRKRPERIPLPEEPEF